MKRINSKRNFAMKKDDVGHSAKPRAVVNHKITLTFPKPGETITCAYSKNTYTIGNVIGEGNFGIVYACHDVWGNDLAVKVLKPKGTYQAVQSAYQTEFQKLLQFRHPYITYMFDAFQCRNAFCIVTERCSMTVDQLINMPNYDGRIWLRPIARCVLQAIHFIHTNQYLHQDLHAANVFTSLVKDEVTHDDRQAIQFKVGDLGISRLIEKVSMQSTMANWMRPPEMIHPKEFGTIDQRIDIYHLGLLFLQILSGKTIQFTEDQVLNGAPRQLALELNSEVGDIIAGALSRHVEHRPSSALELWKSLDAAFGNEW